MKNYEDIDEEFNNFMVKVTQVDGIVKKLASKDKQLQEIGTLEAEKYLNTNPEKCLENFDEDGVQLFVKTNRSVINKKALMEPPKDSNAMTQEAFMQEVSRDAKQRHADKLVRKEKSETFKTQGAKAFRRGEYEKSFCCYTKAIEQIKDSCQLYLNRCLTQIHLKLYEKAIEDAKMALRLNENSLKGWLLLAKAQYRNENFEEFEKAVGEAKERNPEHEDFILDFVEKIKSDVD